jgi:AraC-like DNA-binding protein
MLEFQFDRPFEVPIYGTEYRRVAPRICVIGPMTRRTYKLLICDHVETLTVLFRPQGFSALFAVPMSPLADTGVEGHSLLGAGVSQLFERLGNATSFAERVQFLDSYLLNRLAASELLDDIPRALAQLVVPGIRIRVGDIAFHAGMSARQLERKSLDYMGVSPSLSIRIVRFQRALRMRAVGKAAWSHVAHHLGYFDQTHMIRDFRAFAGETPVSALQQIAPTHLISL